MAIVREEEKKETKAGPVLLLFGLGGAVAGVLYWATRAKGALLLFIAQMTAETNGNIKWLIWIAGLAFAAGIALLVALALRGL